MATRQIQWIKVVFTITFLFCVLPTARANPEFSSWSEVPGQGTTATPDAASVFQNQLYLFGIGMVDHFHYMNMLDGTQWSGWKAVPGGGTTNLADAAAAYNGKLYLFGIGIGDHAHYMNIFDGTRWSGWKAVPGGGTTNLADAATVYRGKLYLFTIGTDRAHYMNVFDGTQWSGWKAVPGGGTTDFADTVTTYNAKLYLFGIGIGDHAHYINVFDGAQWSGWKQVPGSGTTNLNDAATSADGKLYLFGIGIGDHAHYMNVFDGAQWAGWQTVPGEGTTDLADCVATYLGDVYLFAIGRADRHHYVNRAASPRYNEVYQKSAHNTYAQDEDILDVLLYHRIRSIEFDLNAWHTVYGSAAEGDWWVAHSPAEFGSSVKSFSDALDLLAAFHRAVPNHEVVTVWMDHDIQDGDPGHNAAAFDQTLRARLGSALLSPTDLRTACQVDWHGSAGVSLPVDLPALHDAMIHGYCRWPTLDSLRGRLIFVITSGANGYLGDLKNPAAFVATGDVVTNPTIFFGNFGNSGSGFGDADWQHGAEVNGAHFVSRIYYNCVPIPCGIDSPDIWNRAVASQFHHLATNHVNDDQAPWNRTHNIRGYPFCPLAVQPCDQQFLGQVEGGGLAGRLYALTVRSGDLEVGTSTTDNFGFVADWKPAPPAFALSGFVAAPSSDVDDWAKGCLMVRGALDEAAPYYAVCRAADNHGPFVQYRTLGCDGPCGTAHANSPFGEDAVFLRLEVTHTGTKTTTMKGFASNGSVPAPYEPIRATFEIGDATSVLLEDIARPR